MDRTNAARQRRYRANRKAAAADSASLQQKYTALQQKVAELEQELAQRAMAETPRSEGLAMRALKAAMTKPNGGVVGFHDANFEFHEALCLPPYPLEIRSWVPPEARPAIVEMWEIPLFDKDIRAALERFATDGKKAVPCGKNCTT